MPIRARILSTSMSGSVISTPSTKIWPDVGVSSRLTQRSSVDLPEPDGPITQTTWPSSTWKSMPLSTSLSPKDLCSARTSIARRARVDRGERHQRALAARDSMRRTTMESGMVISR